MDATHSVTTTQPNVNTVLVRRCSWCKTIMGSKPGDSTTGETSAICPDCEAALDDFHAPDECRCHWCGKPLDRRDLRCDGAGLPQPLCRACYYHSIAGIETAKTEKGDEDAR
jgi:predicted amidophosphoribosyltransferase